MIVPEVDKHMGEHVDDGPDALVFSRVLRKLAELDNGQQVVGQTKSVAVYESSRCRLRWST